MVKIYGSRFFQYLKRLHAFWWNFLVQDFQICPDLGKLGVPKCRAPYIETLKFQIVRIWQYVATASGEKFVIAFFNELGNFEHFETYFIFSPIWRSGDRQLRQFGDF